MAHRQHIEEHINEQRLANKSSHELSVREKTQQAELPPQYADPGMLSTTNYPYLLFRILKQYNNQDKQDPGSRDLS